MKKPRLFLRISSIRIFSLFSWTYATSPNFFCDLVDGTRRETIGNNFNLFYSAATWKKVEKLIRSPLSLHALFSCWALLKSNYSHFTVFLNQCFFGCPIEKYYIFLSKRRRRVLPYLKRYFRQYFKTIMKYCIMVRDRWYLRCWTLE